MKMGKGAYTPSLKKEELRTSEYAENQQSAYDAWRYARSTTTTRTTALRFCRFTNFHTTVRGSTSQFKNYMTHIMIAENTSGTRSPP